MTTSTLDGKPYAGNPHVWFDEGEVASAKPRRGSLLYNRLFTALRGVAVTALSAIGLAAFGETTSPYATGGEVQMVDGDYVHVFREGGTFEVNVPIGARVLVVGGGGAGGGCLGGGGGGGQVVDQTGVVFSKGDHAVVVGAGGDPFNGAAVQTSYWLRGGNGATSSINGISALGGGGGAAWNQNTPVDTGANGGGGAQGKDGGKPAVVGGFAGGHGTSGGGGGGGAGGAGEPDGVVAGKAGKGGVGLPIDIMGTNITFGAGGGGGAGYGGIGTGGDPGDDHAGRGANGYTPGMCGFPGEDGFGAGGGGGGHSQGTPGGKGGDGIVIVRYAAPPPGQVIVASETEQYGAVAPAYGLHTDLYGQGAQTFTCTSPTNFIDAAETARAVCTGWKLYDLTTDALVAESGTGNTLVCAVDSIPSTGIRIVWSWGVEYKVVASAATGGSVLPPVQWITDGGEATVSVAADAGFGFTEWSGDVAAADKYTSPLTFTVTSPVTLSAGFAQFGAVFRWTGAAGDGLASTAGNWEGNAVPGYFAGILLDEVGRDYPMTWDLKGVVPAYWTQTADYTNIVTISTTYDENDFPMFRVDGDVVINGGVWTHDRNPNPKKKGDGTYRLKVDVGGSFTLGAAAKIDLLGKGLAAGQGLNDGGGERGGSYGGRGKGNNSPCYGSVKHPYHVAAGGSANYGGGCFMLTAAGAATIDGEITVKGTQGQDGTARAYGSAGGTIAITAATISGAGVICADAGSLKDGYGYHSPAGGGRISLIQTAENATYETLPLNVTAYGGFIENPTTHVFSSQTETYSGAGTIYYEVPSDEGRGKLVLKNRFAIPFSYGQFYCTEFNADYMDQDLDFHEIEISHGATMRILGGAITNLANTVFSGDGDGRLVVDADLDLGEDWTWGNVRVYPLKGASIYGTESTTFSNEVVYEGASYATGDVMLAAGANVTHRSAGSATSGYCVDLTVDGNLTVAEGGAVDVSKLSASNKGYPATDYDCGSGYGGRGCNRNDTADLSAPCYGDVREPADYGTKGRHNGSGVGNGGGFARLTVGGTLRVDGMIASTGCGGVHGAASGGSLQLTAASLVGSGYISATGGYSTYGSYGSCGGGGRIAVTLTGEDATMDDYTGSLVAFGRGYSSAMGYYPTNEIASTTTRSGAGTIYIREKGAALGAGTLIVSQNRTDGKVNSRWAYTEICSGVTGLEYGAIEVKEGGILKLNDEVSVKASGWSVAEGCDLVCGEATTQTIKGDAEGNAYLCGNLNFTTLVIEPNVRTLWAEPGCTVTVARAISVVGADAAHRIRIRSTSDGEVFYLAVDAAASQELSFVDVKDCDASNGAQVFAANSVSENSGNWKCENIEPGELNIWTGAADTAWGNAANWSRERAPAATDLVVIRGDAANMPIAPSTDLVLSNLTIQAGATLTSSGKSITVTGGFSNGGDIVFAGNEPLTLSGGGEWQFSEGENYPNLVFAAGSHGTVKGTLNASQLMIGAGAAITFAQGAAVTATLLAADGIGAAISLRPATADGTYGFTVSGYADVKGVSVGGADSSAGMTIYAAASEAMDANVVNWKFEDTRKFWTGAVSGDPSVAGNWQGGELPTEADDVVVMSPTRALTVSAEGFKVKSMTVMDGAVNFSVSVEIVSALVALDGASLTVDAPVTAGSVAMLGTSAMTHTANGATDVYGIDLTSKGDFFIDKDAKIDVTGKGYAVRQGIHGSGKNYGDAFCPAYGGNGTCSTSQGGTATPYVYGSVICPTNNGASSRYGSGGGKVKLTVGGLFTVNGSIISKGTASATSCSAAGGSVWVTAGRLNGTGVIRANGGDCDGGGGAGGRVSLMLTAKGADFSDFAKATVEAYRNVSPSSKLPTGTQCGTIYRQTGDEAFGCGTVYVQNDPKYAGTGCGTTLPSNVLCEPNELRKAKLVIGHGAGVVLQADLTVRDLTIVDNGRLDLKTDYVLTVRSPWHAYPMDQVTNAGERSGSATRPNWSNIRWAGGATLLIIR